MSENTKDIKATPRKRGGNGGSNRMIQGEKAKDFRGTMKKLLQYMTPYRGKLILVFIFATAGAIFTVVGPKILGRVTTELFHGIIAKFQGTGNVNFDAIRSTMFILLFLYIVSALFGYIEGWIMSSVSVKIGYNLRKELSQKINKLPLKYYDKTNKGEVLSRITNDVDTLASTLDQGISQMIRSVTTLVGVLIMMLTISWQMTLIVLGVIPLSMGLVLLVVSRSQKFFRQQQEYLGNVNGHVEEMYTAHVEMKAFNGEKRSIEEFEKRNKKLHGANWRAQFLTSIMMPLINFVGNLGYVAVSIMGGYFAAKGVITVGDVQAFIQYVRQFTQPISQIANISNVFQQTAAAAERVFEFLDEKEEIQEAKDIVMPKDIQGHVEFRKVNFGYDPEVPIIRDFSAIVQPGQKIAIVGPTGAGKTTIVKLLMRFYDIQKGEILVEGHSIYDFAREDLRSMFGMVLQDTWLYNDTIMENIRYGRLDATDEEVIAAAKAAHVDSFVQNLPGGYDMVLNEDADNVSSGQKQLITIARTILANPKMLILDEATSSVDTRTEEKIQKAMDHLMKERTSFVIAHRLSTIKDADIILVMKDGDIIEQGNHDQLLAENGFYADLYKSQFTLQAS